jgi:hypothetical protein
LLDGTKAIRVRGLKIYEKIFKISDEGRGVATISTMLNVTRIYNTVGSCSAMRV